MEETTAEILERLLITVLASGRGCSEFAIFVLFER